MKKKKAQPTEYGTISLPKPLIDKIKKKMSGTGMTSVSAYVSFILRQILSENEATATLSKKEEQEIRSRLKNLGYI